MELLKLKVDHHALGLIPFFSPICRFMLKITGFPTKLFSFHISGVEIGRGGVVVVYRGRREEVER